MFGRRRLFLVGSAGFTLMSAACAAAPSPSALIGFRVLQGASGALMIPQGFGMLKECFAEDEMSKVFGAFGPMMGLSMLAAPILAGALVEANLWGIGWRLVFLINVPIGIATLAGAVRVLPRTVAHPGIRLDTGGMILLGLALTAIIYPLIQGRAEGWPAWTFIALGAGAALLGAFVLWERRYQGDPLIDTRLLSNRTYTSGILVALAFFGAFGGLLLCVSLFAQLGEGFSPIHAGLTLLAMVVGMIVGMAMGMALVGLNTGPRSRSVPGRSRRRDVDGPTVRLHPRRRRDGGGRLRLRRTRGSAAALERDRRRLTRNDLLLSLYRPPADTRTRNHRLGMPGPDHRRVRAHLPAADARPRTARLSQRLPKRTGGLPRAVSAEISLTRG